MRPNKLYFYVGGFPGPYHWIKSIKGQKLIHNMVDIEYEREFTFSPDPEWWEKLNNLLDLLSAWNWDHSYKSQGALDGTHWDLKLRVNGKVLISKGSNAEPKGFDELKKFLSDTFHADIY
ncbi:MAG: hypothetical protein AB7D03_02055 [Thiomicrospira sp.]